MNKQNINGGFNYDIAIILLSFQIVMNNMPREINYICSSIGIFLICLTTLIMAGQRITWHLYSIVFHTTT
jgi:hypothetical protein